MTEDKNIKLKKKENMYNFFCFISASFVIISLRDFHAGLIMSNLFVVLFLASLAILYTSKNQKPLKLFFVGLFVSSFLYVKYVLSLSGGGGEITASGLDVNIGAGLILWVLFFMLPAFMYFALFSLLLEFKDEEKWYASSFKYLKYFIIALYIFILIFIYNH